MHFAPTFTVISASKATITTKVAMLVRCALIIVWNVQLLINVILVNLGISTVKRGKLVRC